VSLSSHVTLLLVDESLPDLFRRARGMLSIIGFSEFGYLHSFQRYSRSKSEIVRNRADFCTFWAPKGPKFWDLDYKIEHTSDHMAKFHGDRPRELGDLALRKKEKKTSTVKHKTAGNCHSGQRNKNAIWYQI